MKKYIIPITKSVEIDNEALIAESNLGINRSILDEEDEILSKEDNITSRNLWDTEW